MPDPQRTWQALASCRGQWQVFFPSEMIDWERRAEAPSKAVCADCPVLSDCAEDVLVSESDASDPLLAAEHPVSLGVVGGMSRWERQWIIDHPAAAAALSLQVAAEGCDPSELRLYGEANGPADLRVTVEHLSLSGLAKKYGYPAQTVRRWLTNNDLTAARRSPQSAMTPWAALLRRRLAAQPERWFSKRELVRELGASVPPERVADKQLAEASRGRSSSETRAKRLIVDSAVRSARASGVIQSKETPEGLLLRWSGQEPAAAYVS